MVWRPQQGGKTCARVEAREAQPVDRTVAADERSRLAIPDKRVVFDHRNLTAEMILLSDICGNATK